MAATKQPDVDIDGTTLEGGGQLLRLSLSLSSLTGTPFHITAIRGKRGPASKPGKDGGMKQAHLVGAQWLAAATNASTQGLEIKSRELIFRPSSTPLDGASVGSTSAAASIWKDVYEGTGLVRRDSRITMTSPGSAFLVLQAILPYLLLTSHVLVRLSITGGTHAWHSMSYEYADQVLFPMLARIGVPPIKMKLLGRGWSMGSNSIGEVQFDITPLKAGTKLAAFTLAERGVVESIYISFLAPNVLYRKYIRQGVINRLLQHYPDVELNFLVDDDSGHEKRLYLLLVAETSNGYRLGRDWLFDQRINRDHPFRSINLLMDKVVKDLKREIDHGGCVDEFLQDQMVVFQALSDGESKMQAGDASLHTQTARWLAEKMVGVKFDADGSCRGIGLTAGKGR